MIDSIIRGFDPQPVSASGYRADSCILNVGGEAVNEAVTLAKLGMQTRIMCYLGKDSAGKMVEDMLLENGVDTGLVIREEEHPTPVTTMFVAADGTRKSITNLAHYYNFHPEKYPDKLTDARAVMLGSLFRAPFDDPEIIGEVVSKAKDRGMLVFADTKLPNFKVLSLKDLIDILPMIDYITPNEDEARYYSGKEQPEDMADVFLSYGVKNVIIKLGSKGCFFKNRDMTSTLPPYDIQAVDATGAGDNFLAGFASELLRGIEVKKALRFANACGAVCTTAAGACTAVRNRAQIIRFMQEHAGR